MLGPTEINSDAKEQSGTEISTGTQRAFGCAKHSPTDIQLDHRHDQTWTNKLLVSPVGVLSIASNACLNCQTTSGNISATFSFRGFVAARATTRLWQLWHLGWNETHFLILRIFLRRLAFGPSYGRRPQDRLQTKYTPSLSGRSLQKKFDLQPLIRGTLKPENNRTLCIPKSLNLSQNSRCS